MFLLWLVDILWSLLRKHGLGALQASLNWVAPSNSPCSRTLGLRCYILCCQSGTSRPIGPGLLQACFG